MAQKCYEDWNMKYDIINLSQISSASNPINGFWKEGFFFCS